MIWLLPPSLGFSCTILPLLTLSDHTDFLSAPQFAPDLSWLKNFVLRDPSIGTLFYQLFSLVVPSYVLRLRLNITPQKCLLDHSIKLPGLAHVILHSSHHILHNILLHFPQVEYSFICTPSVVNAH